MNPVLEEVYSTVMPAAPFVVAAYVLVLLILGVFVVAMLVRQQRNKEEVNALRDAIERRERSIAEQKSE